MSTAILPSPYCLPIPTGLFFLPSLRVLINGTYFSLKRYYFLAELRNFSNKIELAKIEVCCSSSCLHVRVSAFSIKLSSFPPSPFPNPVGNEFLCSGLSQLDPAAAAAGMVAAAVATPPALKVSGPPPPMIYFKDEDRDIEAILHQLSWLEAASPHNLSVPPATPQLSGPLSRSTDCLLAIPPGTTELLEPLRSTSMINVADDPRLEKRRHY